MMIVGFDDRIGCVQWNYCFFVEDNIVAMLWMYNSVVFCFKDDNGVAISWIFNSDGANNYLLIAFVKKH